MRVQVVRWKR